MFDHVGLPLDLCERIVILVTFCCLELKNLGSYLVPSLIFICVGWQVGNVWFCSWNANGVCNRFGLCWSSEDPSVEFRDSRSGMSYPLDPETCILLNFCNCCSYIQCFICNFFCYSFIFTWLINWLSKYVFSHLAWFTSTEVFPFG